MAPKIWRLCNIFTFYLGYLKIFPFSKSGSGNTNLLSVFFLRRPLSPKWPPKISRLCNFFTFHLGYLKIFSFSKSESGNPNLLSVFFCDRPLSPKWSPKISRIWNFFTFLRPEFRDSLRAKPGTPAEGRLAPAMAGPWTMAGPHGAPETSSCKYYLSSIILEVL